MIKHKSQNIGINHIIQGFDGTPAEVGFIGVLHLWWSSEDSKIEYDNPRYFVKGTWHGEWLDSPEDAIKLSMQIQKSRLYDENKLIQIAIHYAKKVLETPVKKIDKDHLEKKEPLLN